jgi:hypothetical protein
VSVIRLGTKFAVDSTSEVALGRAQAYLRAAGYAAELGSSSQLRAKRGHEAFNLFAVSPRAWAVEVDVTALARDGRLQVSSVFTVTTAGQAPSAHENAFWREEVLGLERAVVMGDTAAQTNRRLAVKAITINCVAIPVLLAVWTGPVAIAALGYPRSVGLLVAAAVAGFGLAWLTARYLFGIFAPTDGLPFVSTPEESSDLRP